MNARPFIDVAFPRRPTKQLEFEFARRGVEISPRQAWRIVQTGRVPLRLESIFWEVIEYGVQLAQRRAERADEEIRQRRHSRMVARAEARVVAADPAAAAVAPGQAGRTDTDQVVRK